MLKYFFSNPSGRYTASSKSRFDPKPKTHAFALPYTGSFSTMIKTFHKSLCIPRRMGKRIAIHGRKQLPVMVGTTQYIRKDHSRKTFFNS